MPIDPAFSVTGPEFRIDSIAGPADAGGGRDQIHGVGFGALLGKSLQSLAAWHNEA